MKKDVPPSPAASNGNSGATATTTTKSYEGIKYKGKLGSVTFTLNSMIFSTPSKDVSWKWTAVKKHLVKSVNEKKHMIKLIFHQEEDPPVILEVETRGLVEQLRGDIAAAKKRVTLTSTKRNSDASNSSGASNGAKQLEQRQHKHPAKTNSKGLEKVPSKKDLLVSSSSSSKPPKKKTTAPPPPQSPKKSTEVPPVPAQAPKTKSHDAQSAKGLPPTKAASNNSTKEKTLAKPGAHRVKNSSSPETVKALGILRDPKENSEAKGADTQSTKKKLPAKSGSNSSTKKKAPAKPGAHSVKDSSVPQTVKTLGILKDSDQKENPAKEGGIQSAKKRLPPKVGSNNPTKKNKKTPVVKPGAHHSANVPATAKTLGIPEDNPAEEGDLKLAADTRKRDSQKKRLSFVQPDEKKKRKSNPPAAAVASLPGAHSISSYNVSQTAKTLEEENELIHSVIQERAAALSRSQSVDDVAIAEAFNNKNRRRTPIRRTKSYDPAPSSSAGESGVVPRPLRRGRRRPAARNPSNESSDVAARSRNREAAAAATASDTSRPRARMPARTYTAGSMARRPPQVPSRESVGNPDSVLRAIEKERQYANQKSSSTSTSTSNSNRNQATANSSTTDNSNTNNSNNSNNNKRKPAASVDEDGKPAATVEEDQASVTSAPAPATRSRRQPARTVGDDEASVTSAPVTRSRRNRSAKATVDDDASVASAPATRSRRRPSKAIADDEASVASAPATNSGQRRQQRQPTTESQPQQLQASSPQPEPEQPQRQSVVASNSIGTRPSVVETRHSNASVATATTITSSSSSTVTPSPLPLPTPANRNASVRPGAQAIPGIGSAFQNESENDNLNQIDEEEFTLDPEQSPVAPGEEGSPPPEQDLLIEAHLVEEESRAFQQPNNNDVVIAGDFVEAKPMPEQKEMGYREIWKNRKVRIGFCILLLIMLLIMTIIIMAVTIPRRGGDGGGNNSNNNREEDNGSVASTGVIAIDNDPIVVNVNTSVTTPVATEPPTPSLIPTETPAASLRPTPEPTMVPTKMPTLPPQAIDPQIPAGVAEFMEYVFDYAGVDIPQSTRQALEDPSSPQSLAQGWLYQDPNLEEIRPTRVIQRFALATLYHSTGGKNWNTNENWLEYSVNECEWYFPQNPCELDYGEVHQIFIENNNLEGTLPPEIFLLPYLDTLYVIENPNLVGRIPSQIGLANELMVHVAFVGNQLEGSLPTEIGELENLQILFLGDSPSIGGFLPTEIGKLSNLDQMHIYNAGLSGTIPTELGPLPLAELNLSMNKFLGSIPSELGLLTGLVDLMLQENNGIFGWVPFELGALTVLSHADFSQTSLTGSLPWPLCERLNSDLVMHWVGTKLHCGGAPPPDTDLLPPVDPNSPAGLDPYLESKVGTDIPQSTRDALQDITSPQFQAQDWLLQDPNLAELTGDRILQRFALATLFFSTAGTQWRVSELWLDHEVHECDWKFPTTPPCEGLEYGKVDHLAMFDNNLAGTIPPEVFLLPYLGIVEFHDNPDLEGDIPSEIGLASETLFNVIIHGNQLAGSIPTEIGELRSLEILQISENPAMVGPLPIEIGGLTNLKHLVLYNVGLTGSMPWEIGRLPLFDLDLSSNNFVSTLPAEYAGLTNLNNFNLHNNNGLFGTISQNLGALSQLVTADFSRTSLTGSIPYDICLRMMDNNGPTVIFDEPEMFC